MHRSSVSSDVNSNDRIVLSYLRKLSPEKNKHCLDKILSLAVGAMGRACEKEFVRWLERDFDESQSRKLYKKTLLHTQSPFIVDYSKEHGWVIAHITHSEAGSRYTKCPCIVEPDYNKSDNTTLAHIYLQDEILLLGTSGQVWWRVVEMRAHNNTVMLVHMKETRHQCCTPHYREVSFLLLVGCVVRRTFSTHTITFQFPVLDAAMCLSQLRELVQQESDSYPSEIFGLTQHSEHEKYLREMQQQASVRQWLHEKENLAQARSLLRRINAAVALHPAKWLAVGHALRVLSGGGDDLLLLWQQWTAAGCHEDRTKVCRRAWKAMRPATNCDDDSIVRARNYIHSKMDELKKINKLPTKTKGHINSTSASQCSDPLVRQLIDDAKNTLRNDILAFWTDNVSATKTGQVIPGAPATAATVLRVPAAVYAWKGNPPKKNAESSFEEMSEVAAIITIGDVLALPDGKHAEECQWCMALEIDLLLARVRVTPCVAPPEAWFISYDEPKGIWINVSELWRVVVYSRLDQDRKNVFDKRKIPFIVNNPSLYCTFLTPIASSKQAMSTLRDFIAEGEALETRLDFHKAANIVLQVLAVSSTAITLGWQVETRTVNVSLRCSRDTGIGDWRVAYAGSGAGCIIQDLEPEMKYHIKFDYDNCGSTYKSCVYLSATTLAI